MRFAVLLMLLATLLTPSASAAGQAPVDTGSVVRIRAPMVSPRWTEGRLVRLGADSVVLRRARGDTLAVPRFAVEQLQQRAGRDHVLGAIRGLGIGAIALAVPAALVEARHTGGESENGLLTQLAAITGGALGLAVGAVVGTKAWHRVPLAAAPNGSASESTHTAADSATALAARGVRRVERQRNGEGGWKPLGRPADPCDAVISQLPAGSSCPRMSP